MASLAEGSRKLEFRSTIQSNRPSKMGPHKKPTIAQGLRDRQQDPVKLDGSEGVDLAGNPAE